MSEQSCAFCLHGHFYQPPRSDPFTGKMPREPEAAPYANFNEKITAECYAPNAEMGNFAHISFNLGSTLARWMEHEFPGVYGRIVAAEQEYAATYGTGNGLAQAVHHTILPLARTRDKRCQIRWGVASFKHRFGHLPDGMWLPEMAVDSETLECMAAEGLRFTILSEEQVRGDLEQGGGPYTVKLPNGGSFAVFVRDRNLSNSLAFGVPDPIWARDWAHGELGWRCARGRRLVLLATDGETFGHHYRHGAEFLRRLIEVLNTEKPYRMTTLGRYLREHPPRAEVALAENSAWSCGHGLARWVTGCDCTPGQNYWKGALRRALDNLAGELDCAFVDTIKPYGVNPWELRDAYIHVVLGEMDGDTLLGQFGLAHRPRVEAEQVLLLLEAQLHRQRMYTSCTFFFEELARVEPRYAIANAARAVALTRYATGEDFTASFRRDLRVAVSERTGINAAQILDDLLDTAQL